jgi:hypothetical protein
MIRDRLRTAYDMLQLYFAGETVIYQPLKTLWREAKT